MRLKFYLLSSVLFTAAICLAAQEDTLYTQVQEFHDLHKQSEQIRISDSIRKDELNEQIKLLNENNRAEREKLNIELRRIEMKDSSRKAELIEKVKSLKETATGYPVILFSDTLFNLYNKIGASTPAERARNISNRIKKLFYDNSFLRSDSLYIEESDNTSDIVFGDMIIMSVSELDAVWHNQTRLSLANQYSETINSTISAQRKERSIIKLTIRIGLVIIVVAGILFLIWLLARLHSRIELYITSHKEKWLRSLSYKNYTFLSVEQELRVIHFVLKIFKWFMILLLLYLVLPLVFSIFPFTRGFADSLFGLIWSPFKAVFSAVWDYLPNLFSILVIVLVMKYFIRLVKYIFTEIEAEKLKISGFHSDWAMPTFTIIRFLLYAFMFILIFPYLPGSDSGIFKGVSVFVGVLFSLGSTSAIANMIAGLVITYMRPFKIGDRIKIGEMTGDVVEKTLLVTRLRTTKNEEITIPNSAVLSGNTINYSKLSRTDGLIVHSTVTIGYDVPWKVMHEALIEAALRTDFVIRKPVPFVLQTSLDDYYVSYQINAYTRDSNKQAFIYSELHKNIQDVCNEKGIEIMSPHYRAVRDGNMTTIPVEYLSKEYSKPSFDIDIQHSPGKKLPDDK